MQIACGPKCLPLSGRCGRLKRDLADVFMATNNVFIHQDKTSIYHRMSPIFNSYYPEMGEWTEG